MRGKKTGIAVLAVLIACFIILGILALSNNNVFLKSMNESEFEEFLNTEFDSLAKSGVLPSEYIAENNKITVNSMKKGENKDTILSCTIETPNAYDAVSPNYNDFMSANAKKKSGMQKTELDFQMEFEDGIVEMLKNAERISKNIEITVYETSGGYKVYTSDEIVNEVYGGTVNIQNDVKGITEYTDASGSKHKVESTNIAKGLSNCFDLTYSPEVPDTSTTLGVKWNNLKADFQKNFIDHDRWLSILQGLWATIKLTILSCIIGIILGFLIAFVRCTYLKTPKPKFILKFFNKICEIYLTITRGTPVVVQIMIIYFVIFMPIGVDKFIAAVICFGLNSGAYVAEIVRGGIMSVDAGQTEAGRSLGFSYMQTMFHIVFPQAFKAVLPALANEFVSLLKETSIAFYIGVGDLMYAGNAIRAATYSAFMPLVAVAIIYLIMVIGLSKLVGLLERRLRNSER